VGGGKVAVYAAEDGLGTEWVGSEMILALDFFFHFLDMSVTTTVMIHAYFFLEVLSLDAYSISENAVLRQPRAMVLYACLIRKAHAIVELAPSIDSLTRPGLSSAKGRHYRANFTPGTDQGCRSS